MTEHTNTSPQRSLFARKGEAAPAPAVAYVSLRQMQGESEQREEGPDRREQWGAPQNDGESTDRRAHLGPDHDGRRHFTPRTGLAYGQRYVPWAAPETEADAPQDTARVRKAKTTVGPLSVASLSSLIHRHRDGFAQPEAPPATGPTKLDLTHLLAARPRGRPPASPKLPAEPATPHAAQPSATRKPKMKRKKVTVRLEFEQFSQIKALAERAGKSRQSVLAKAVAAYLNKNF